MVGAAPKDSIAPAFVTENRGDVTDWGGRDAKACRTGKKYSRWPSNKRHYRGGAHYSRCYRCYRSDGLFCRKLASDGSKQIRHLGYTAHAILAYTGGS